MTPEIGAELLKLRTTRTTWGVLIAAIAVAGLLGAATAATAGQEGAAALGTAQNLASIVGASSLPAFVMFMIGILAMAGEYQHRTVTATFLATPRRGRVLVAKLVAVAVVGPIVAATVMVAALAAALPLMWLDGAAVDVVNRSVLDVAAGNLLAGVLFGVLGASLGAVLRNQLIAVVAALTWALLGEGIVSIFAGAEVARWLPGFAAQAVVSHGNDVLDWWAAAVLLAGYTTAGALIATRITLVRDVT